MELTEQGMVSNHDGVKVIYQPSKGRLTKKCRRKRAVDARITSAAQVWR